MTRLVNTATRRLLMALVTAAALAACPASVEPPAATGDDGPAGTDGDRPAETVEPTADVNLAPAEPYVWALTDVSLDAGVQDRLAHQKGIGVADYDGNGFQDMFVTNPGQGPILFLNNGDGTFASQLDLPTTGNDWGPVVFDYDMDGDPDVFVFCGGRGSACLDAAYRNDGVDPETGDVVFTDVSTGTGIGDTVRQSIGGALADYDLDGDLDIFVPVHYRLSDLYNPLISRADMLFHNNGDGTFTDVAEQAGVASAGPSVTSTWLDYDRDGDPDLYVPALGSTNTLYENMGDGTFAVVTPESLTWPFLAFGVVAQDFDNDGWVDLLVAEIYQTFIETYFTIPGPVGDRLFLNDKGQGWIDASFDSKLIWEDGDTVAPRAGTMGYQLGDLDLDGYMEVFFGNGSPEVNGGQINRLISAVPNEYGTITWVDRTPHIDVPVEEDGADPPYPSYPYRTHGSVLFDFDHDDDVDLFIGNGGHPPAQEEPNQLFRNDAAAVHLWVRVKLVGQGHNPDGIGAEIRVADAAGDDATWHVFRHVMGTTGFHVTEPCVLQVGTGKHDGPYVVTVTWPGGAQTVVEDVTARTTVEVAQP